MIRALKTAELVSGFGQINSQMNIANQLKERDFKSFEGQPWNKMDEVLEQSFLKDYNELDIEPLDSVKRRLQSFQEMLQHNISQITQVQSNILIVTHGEIFSALLELMLKNSSCKNDLSFPYWPRNLQIAKLTFQEASFKLCDIDFSSQAKDSF